MSFLFFLLQNGRTEGWNRSCPAEVEQGEEVDTNEEEVAKGYRKVNTVQILCAHVCKWKKIPVETILGIAGER
jgi:hypothetical protein